MYTCTYDFYYRKEYIYCMIELYKARSISMTCLKFNVKGRMVYTHN